jgi:hypothetical protein
LEGAVTRFGLITTNSLRQTFNRAVLQRWLSNGVALTMAIPDHPWVDNADGAAVRIAMTVVGPGSTQGELLQVSSEMSADNGEVEVAFTRRVGVISPSLTVTVDVPAAPALLANKGMSCVGYRVNRQQAMQLDPQFGKASARARPLLTGSDITKKRGDVYAIDLYGLTADDVRMGLPAVYQHIHDNVKPERDLNNRRSLRERWWIFGEARSTFRPALAGCARALATSLTAKHRTFVFVEASDICDSTTVMFALPDALHMGVMSSRVHVSWALAAGGRLGVGNDPRYNKSHCFDSFPFPSDDTGLSPALADHIRTLAEQIDAHRKARQSAYAEVTLTGLYNVLEKLRSGEALTDKEKLLHEQGLVGVLKSLHDELDTAVLRAYGWADLALPADTESLLERLLALNTRRAGEEAAGAVRWLRPSFQDPAQREMDVSAAPKSRDDEATEDEAEQVAPAPTAAVAALPWPATLPEQVRSVAELLAASPAPLGLAAIERAFKGKGPWKKGLPRILDTLEAVGRARQTEGGWRG